VLEPGGADFEVSESDDVVTLSTSRLRAEVSLQTGLVTFYDAGGNPVLTEAVRDEFRPVEVAGEQFYAIRQQFNRGTDEGLYGLGQHQNGQFNYNGEDVVLEQHNIVDVVPFFVSTRNYGVLWDNNGSTRFGDPREYQGLDASLIVYDENGTEGGLTGRYYRGNEVVVTRTEADPDYQYLPPEQFLNEGRRDYPDLDMLRYMEMLAVFECSSKEMLPEPTIIAERNSVTGTPASRNAAPVCWRERKCSDSCVSGSPIPPR